MIDKFVCVLFFPVFLSFPFFLQDWYLKAQQILFDAAEEGLFDQTPVNVLSHFLEACAAILSRQLWSVILKSAKQYVQFFQRFTVVQADLSSNNENTIEHARSVQRTGIYIHMIKNKDDICYAGDSNDRLGGMEYNIVQLLNTIVEYLVVPQQNTTSMVDSILKEQQQQVEEKKRKKKTEHKNSSSSDAEAVAVAIEGVVGSRKLTTTAAETAAAPPPPPPPSNSNNNSLSMFPRPSYFLMQTKRLPSTLIPLSKSLINPNYPREHVDVNVLRAQLESIVDTNCEEARRLLLIYSSISETLTSPQERKDNDTMSKKGFGENGAAPTQHDFQERIHTYLQLVEIIDKEYLNVIPCGMFLIQCQQLKEQLKQSAFELSKQLLTTLAKNTVARNVKTHQRFQKIKEKSEMCPSTSEDLSLLEKYFEATLARGGEVDQLKRLGLNLITQTSFLIQNSCDTTTGGCGFMMLHTYLQPTGGTLIWLGKTDGMIMAGKNRLRLERDRLESALKRSRDTFMKSLDYLLIQIEEYKLVVDIGQVWEMEKSIKTIQDEIQESKQQVLLFNSEESTLGMSITTFVQMEVIRTTLLPFSKLWGLAAKSKTSIQDSTEIQCVYELDAEKIEKNLKNIIRQCNRLISTLSEIAPDTIDVAESIIQTCRDFLKRVPLIAVLSNGGMRTRHWEQVDAIVGRLIRPDTTTTLEQISYLDKHIEKLQQISDVAFKEWAVEKMLQEMDDSWLPIGLTFNPSFRDTGAAIVKGDSIDIVQEILDEQLVKVQTLHSLPQAQHFKEDVVRQEEFLLTTEKILELILKVQSAWMYLYPVFGSDDIKKALANESDAFATIDSEWRRITTRAQVHPQILRISYIENIVERLDAMSLSLDSIQLGLKRYLEEKRNGFPRFFFLSDEELLEILAETRNPKKIQPFLRKIFEGIRSVKFEGSGEEDKDGVPAVLEIVAMQSDKQEEVWLSSPVDPLQFGSGACEKWLVELENRMRDTICAELRVAIEQYDAHSDTTEMSIRCEKRQQWIMARSAQVVLGIDQLLWTAGAEKAMRLNGWKGLLIYADELEQMQLSIVRLVRGSLSKVHRSTLGAMLTLDVSDGGQQQ